MSEARSETVLELISLVGEGDTDAVDCLLQRYRPYLHIVAQRAMRQMFQTKFDESDIVQQTCLDAFNGISSFRGKAPAEFSAWISTILQRNIATLVRNYTAQKRDVRREMSLVPPTDEDASLKWHLPVKAGNGPESLFIKGEMALLLADAMLHLTDEQRTAVQMRFLEGYKLSDISRHMELPSHAVARLITQGVDTLRRNLPAGFQDLV